MLSPHLNFVLVVVVVVEALVSEICVVAPVLEFYAYQVDSSPLLVDSQHWRRDLQP